MNGGLTFSIALAAMAVGGLFSALFHALQESSRSTLEEIAAIRSRGGAGGGARRVAKILGDMQGHATAVALPRITANLAVVVLIVFWVSGLRGQAAPTWVEVAIGLAVASVLVWIFGVVVPQSVARHAGEKTVYTWSPLIRLCYITLAPLNAVVNLFDEIVRRLAGEDEDAKAEAVEAEIMSVVEEAQQEGQVDQAEADMIEAVVQFRSKTVEQIMTPRTEVQAFELTNDIGAVISTIKRVGHSRIPVYQGNLDHIAGIFYVKDLMRWLAGEGTRGAGKPFDLKSILRPALFVPETKTVRELLTELIQRKVHIVLVADEYGGTSGLVTIEDILEEIVGEISDEYELDDEAAPEVSVRPESRTAEIDARAYIDDANDALRSIGVELPSGEDYDTVAGLVVTMLGRIPKVGETLRVGDVGITVLEAEPTRVSRVKVEVAEKAAEERAPVPEPAAEPGVRGAGVEGE